MLTTLKASILSLLFIALVTSTYAQKRGSYSLNFGSNVSSNLSEAYYANSNSNPLGVNFDINYNYSLNKSFSVNMALSSQYTHNEFSTTDFYLDEFEQEVFFQYEKEVSTLDISMPLSVQYKLPLGKHAPSFFTGINPTFYLMGQDFEKTISMYGTEFIDVSSRTFNPFSGSDYLLSEERFQNEIITGAIVPITSRIAFKSTLALGKPLAYNNPTEFGEMICGTGMMVYHKALRKEVVFQLSFQL